MHILIRCALSTSTFTHRLLLHNSQQGSLFLVVCELESVEQYTIRLPIKLDGGFLKPDSLQHCLKEKIKAPKSERGATDFLHVWARLILSTVISIRMKTTPIFDRGASIMQSCSSARNGILCLGIRFLFRSALLFG